MKLTHSIIGIAKISSWAQRKFEVSLDDLFAQSGIEKSRLQDPHAVVVPREEIQFYRNLVKLCPHDELALKAGFQLTASSYGVWGLAIQSCENLIDGIRMGMKYIDFTYTFNKIHYTEHQKYGCIAIVPNENLGDLSSFMVQRDAAAIVRLIYDGLRPNLPFERIRIECQSLPNKLFYEEALQCPIELNTGRCEIIIPKQQLDLRLNQANQLTWKLCCEQLDSLYDKRKIIETYAERIQLIIKEHPMDALNMSYVSSLLRVSPRTLRDRLSSEGTSYKEILENLRKQQAQVLLKDESLTLDQVAEKLGYSDATSFSHACKRWFNKAPRAV